MRKKKKYLFFLNLTQQINSFFIDIGKQEEIEKNKKKIYTLLKRKLKNSFFISFSFFKLVVLCSDYLFFLNPRRRHIN